MPETSMNPPKDLHALIQKIAFSDTMIFDPMPQDEETILEACGKCGVCGECGQCVKGSDEMIRRDIDILRRRIEKNPEILRDIKKRWDIDVEPR